MGGTRRRPHQRQLGRRADLRPYPTYSAPRCSTPTPEVVQKIQQLFREATRMTPCNGLGIAAPARDHASIFMAFLRLGHKLPRSPLLGVEREASLTQMSTLLLQDSWSVLEYHVARGTRTLRHSHRTMADMYE